MSIFSHVVRHRRLAWWVLMSIAVSVYVATSGPASAAQDDQRLKPLFIQLRTAKDSVEAARVEGLIWRIWGEYHDQEVAQLFDQGIEAMNRGDLNVALEAFDEVVRRAPDFAEGWNKRATVFYLLERFDESVRDIASTLRLEPRHFGALSGLGLIEEALGHPAEAIRAYEKALSIHPYLSGARQKIYQLRREIRGKEI